MPVGGQTYYVAPNIFNIKYLSKHDRVKISKDNLCISKTSRMKKGTFNSCRSSLL